MPRTVRADFAILGWLSIEPMSGYDLKRRIEGSIAMFWNEGFSSIYPTLRRLSEAGLIEESEPRPGDHPSRRVWRVSQGGIDQLKGWLAQPFAVTQTRNECALKVFFGQHLDPATLRRHLSEYKRQHEEGLVELTKIDARLGSDPSESAPYRRMTSQLGLRLCQATIDWCEDALAELPDGTPNAP